MLVFFVSFGPYTYSSFVEYNIHTYIHTNSTLEKIPVLHVERTKESFNVFFVNNTNNDTTTTVYLSLSTRIIKSKQIKTKQNKTKQIKTNQIKSK